MNYKQGHFLFHSELYSRSSCYIREERGLLLLKGHCSVAWHQARLSPLLCWGPPAYTTVELHKTLEALRSPEYMDGCPSL